MRIIGVVSPCRRKDEKTCRRHDCETLRFLPRISILSPLPDRHGEAFRKRMRPASLCAGLILVTTAEAAFYRVCYELLYQTALSSPS